MREFLIILTYGFSYGFVLFLSSIGLSIALGMLGIVNVAHGVMFLLGGYVGIWIAMQTGNWLYGILGAALAGGLVSLVIGEGFLIRFQKQPLQQILITFGFVYIISNLALWIWGAATKVAQAPEILSGSIVLSDFSIPLYRLAMIIFGIIAFVILFWLQQKTLFGVILRGGMDDPQMISALGINLRPIVMVAFFIGLMIAGMTAFAASPILGGINAWVGPRIFFMSIAVVIVGGIGSVEGTLAGGLLLGILFVSIATFFPEFPELTTYIVMIVILLIRPRGLLGKEW